MTVQEAGRVLMPFGKYRNRDLAWIAEVDPLYLDWLAGLEDLRHNLALAVPVMAKAYAREIEEAVQRRPE